MQNSTFERTVFHDYKIRPDAYGKLMRDSVIRFSAYVLASISVFTWFRRAEPTTWQDSGQMISIVLMFFILAGFYAAARYYHAGKNFRMITTDHHLEFQSVSSKVEIQFADIQRVERTKENVLLVYTHVQPKKAVLAISDTLTDRETLEETLKQHTTIVDNGKLPRQFNVYFVAVQTYFIITALLFHFLSHEKSVVISTGIVILGILAYAVNVVRQFSKQIKTNGGVFLFGLLSVLVIARMLIYIL